MTENKTQQTVASVDAHIASIEDDRRRADCLALITLFRKVTKHEPTMWGKSLVGFGRYHYKYASGREGVFCTTGFASRKGDISVYLMASFPGQDELLALLGKHKMGKACLYIRRLADVDSKVLEKLIAGSVAEIIRRHG